jgi:hypothetical protein
MRPLFVIAPPRSRASLLKRLLADHPQARLVPTPAGGGHFGDSISYQSRKGWVVAVPLWSWLLENWPSAQIIFLMRDQGAIEARMMASQSRYQWIPKWGKCLGCCGGQVKAMHDSFAEFHELNPTRTVIIQSDDLLNFETAAAALPGLSRETWEREIAVITNATREALPDTDPAVDPFHPHATLATLEALPGPDSPPAPADPFADDTTVEDLAELPGPTAPDYATMMPLETRRIIPERPRHRAVKGADTVVYTLRYGAADWLDECVPTLETWCVRHDYDLQVVGKPDVELPDEKFATVAMIREFLASGKQWMIFVDADVAIHPTAPGWPRLPGFAAAHDKPMNMRHWGKWLKTFFPTVPADGWTYRNSGIWSFDRDSAKLFLEQVDLTSEWQPGVREQHQFNLWAILASHRGMRVPLLPAEWNQLAKYESDKPAWFYHLAGKTELKTRYLKRLRDRQYLPRKPRAFEIVQPRSERAIVWPWLASVAEWDELRFSLRSVERFFADKDCPLYILGDTPPPWLVPGGRVEFLRMNGYSRHPAEGMFEARVTGYQIAENVLWMNDDIFLLRDQDWPDFEVALHEGNQTGNIVDMLGGGLTYKRWMGEAFADLVNHGLSRVRKFATHTPVLYQIDKVREILGRFHIHHKGSFANLYHNWHHTPCRGVGRDKAREFPADPAARFLCHGNYLPSVETRAELERLFPDPAPWEDPALSPASCSRLPSVRLCVATFNEDVSWVEKTGLDACIYDATGRRPGLIHVRNEGREAGQYLKHIIRHYGEFRDYELFLQGNPFDHAPDVFETLAARSWQGQRVSPLGPLMGVHPQVHAASAAKLAKDLGLQDVKETGWTYGAMFAASREALMSRPREWWEALLQRVLDDGNGPWAIERLWLSILSPPLLTSPVPHVD